MAISDVLWEARQQIEEYLKNNPIYSEYDEQRELIERCLAIMEECQGSLDKVPD